MRAKLVCVAALMCILIGTMSASATLVNLQVFENDSNVDVSGLVLTADVQDQGTSVDFTFRNDSSIDSFISAIYVESTSLTKSGLKNGRIVTPQPAGVNFSSGASPSKPPGSISNFGGTWGGTLFSVHAKSPSPKNGLNPGESVTLRFDYHNIAFADVTQALQAGSLRLAEHVQGINDCASVWATSVPLPSSLVLFGTSLIGWLTFDRNGRRRTA